MRQIMGGLSVFVLMGVIAFIGAFFLSSLVGSTDTAKESSIKKDGLRVATLAGGCFWCVEQGLEAVDGVKEVVSGYTGGSEPDPRYEEVASGNTGHREAVRVYYDASEVSFATILQAFWQVIDPTDAKGQFADRGFQYSPAIYYHNQEQKRVAEEQKTLLEQSGKFDEPVAVPILPVKEFYRAEDYHQQYYEKNPVQYKVYKYGSGRTQYIKDTWEEGKQVFKKSAETGKRMQDFSTYTKPTDAELKTRLSDIQYAVTQKDKTEQPYENRYWNHSDAGIYVDVVSGEPLFSSTHKFMSGTGWPSFTQPIDEQFIVEKRDHKLLIPRTEIRSRYADSHLGHVFEDGPEPTGLRFCMNSAALDFIPKEQMQEKGYGAYLYLFDE